VPWGRRCTQDRTRRSDGRLCNSATPLVERRVDVLHWHGDTFDLPSGATHLALTSAYENQAFAWGTHALALQFHAEVRARDLERWLISHAHEIERTPGLSVQQLRQDARIRAPRLQTRAACCWQTWLNQAIDDPAESVFDRSPLESLFDEGGESG
jgi:hypothetical protein